MRLGALGSVDHRDDLVAGERELAGMAVVTVLIKDQQCAAEKRRLRKRGRLARLPRRVFVNERICEGCGDCGEKSNCLSVEPIETEFGRKTAINQSSCNQDYSCLLGDCPSFMTVTRRDSPPRRPITVDDPPFVPAEPVPCVPADDFSVFMAGIGGTGVITVNQLLGMAAMLAGRSVRAIDQIGSSQKAGPVVSHLHVSAVPVDGATRIMAGAADVYLVFAMLTAAEPHHLAFASPDRTVLVANDAMVPTGFTVTDATRHLPPVDALRSRLERVTRPERFHVDALAASRQLTGGDVATNVLLLGCAWQAGTVPLPLAGLKIVDLSMFFSGPLATQIAGDAGADIIKVESVQRIDGWRGATVATVPRPWERSPNVNWVNRSKRGITLNLADERGVALLKELVADADILIENYTPRVMGNFGLEYAVLREINPRLIMMSMPGFGGDVSWRDYVAF